jgi:hypothetical protein
VGFSAGGTKALVDFSDGTPRVFDLTKGITGIAPSGPPLPQHRLPQQRFPLLSNGEVCLLDDFPFSSTRYTTSRSADAASSTARELQLPSYSEIVE